MPTFFHRKLRPVERASVEHVFWQFPVQFVPGVCKELYVLKGGSKSPAVFVFEVSWTPPLTISKQRDGATNTEKSLTMRNSDMVGQ